MMIRTLLFVVFCFALHACANDYVPVKIVSNDDGELHVTENNIPLGSAENFKCVLLYYGEDFKERDEAILVPKNLMEDIELMYNYQSKSMNGLWLESHDCK